MKIFVNEKAARRMQGFYPFGYCSDITNIDNAKNGVIDVYFNKFIAKAYFNDKSNIPLRLISWEQCKIDKNFYYKRIKQAIERRNIKNTNAIRLINAEADFLPGIIVDIFNDSLFVQIRNLGAEMHKEMIFDALKELTQVSFAYERSDTNERLKEGLEKRNQVLWGSKSRVDFYEDDLNLHFNIEGSKKTGFFLDQRDNRLMVKNLIKENSDFLDVYSYTGTFALHAAKRGAKVIAIDKDAVALGVFEATARENNLEVSLRLGDAIEQLEQLQKENKKFDFIVFDPPTLAKRREDITKAKNIFTNGSKLCIEMLKSNGHLLVSTCAHYLNINDLLDSVRVAAGKCKKQMIVKDITLQPSDHPHLLSVPESLYLKSILFQLID